MPFVSHLSHSLNRKVNLLNATNEYYLNNHLALAAPAAIIHARAHQKKVIGSDNYEEFTLAIKLNALTVHGALGEIE